MTQIKRPVKGIHRIRTKRPSTPEIRYHYAWRGGPRFWASNTGVPESGPAYWDAYQRAVDGTAPAAGKFRLVLQAFLKSRDYQQLAARTKKDYQRSMGHENGIDARFGDAPIDVFNHHGIRKIVYAWRDSFESDRVADTFKTHLVAIVNWGVDRGYLQNNYLAGMSNLYKVDRSEIIWTREDLDLFMFGDAGKGVAPAPEWLQRLIVAATETGLRPADLAILSRNHIKTMPNGRRIQIRTAKRKRIVSIPVTDRMGEVIDATPKDQMMIIVGGKGTPFAAPASLGQAVGRRRDEAGVRPELRLYDARGTAVTRLFSAGATIRDIALHMGWAVEYASRMINVYAAMNPDSAGNILVQLNREE